MSLKNLEESSPRDRASEGVTEISLRGKDPKLEKKLILFLSDPAPRQFLSYSTRLPAPEESTRFLLLRSMKFPLSSKIKFNFLPFLLLRGLPGVEQTGSDETAPSRNPERRSL